MSLSETEDGTFSRFEEHLTLIRNNDNEFIGKYPLQPFRPGARGTYGGDMIAQGILACWETVEDAEFSPSSLHSYFLKAGSDASPIRWEVKKSSDGRNLCTRLAQAYQSGTNELCFMVMMEFARNNHIRQRKVEYIKAKESGTAVGPSGKAIARPYEFQRSPHYYFDKYFDKLDEMNFVQHTDNYLLHVLPPELFRRLTRRDGRNPAHRQLGIFFKLDDDLTKCKNATKTKFCQLGFASDSVWLSTLMKALGVPYDHQDAFFFKVSLDHSMWFHDMDFDPTEWMFLEYTFVRMSNNRVLAEIHIFTRDGRMIATVNQEALTYVPDKILDKAVGGTSKL